MKVTSRVGAALLAFHLGTALFGAVAPAQTAEVGFNTDTTQAGLVRPTGLAVASDGRLFVTEKRGTIQTYDSLHDPTPTLFADLRTSVHNYHDRGLLSVEVDRQWPARPYVYVFYTYDAPVGGTAPVYGSPDTDSDPCPATGCPAQVRIGRLAADLSLGVPAMTTQTVLLRDVCHQFQVHDGGGLRQDADGSLVVSVGEAGSPWTDDYGQLGGNPCGDPVNEGGSLRAQDIRTPADPTTTSGAVIRIDPDTGAAWPANPLIGSPDLEARKIIAYGLRNPFRLALRNGEVWVGDVGDSRFEELNHIDPAAPVENLGWPCYEGAARHPEWDALNLPLCESLYAAGTTTPPTFSYCHLTSFGTCGLGGGAISSVEFYDGTSYPARYHGALLFADYTRQSIYALIDGQMELVAGDLGGPVDLRSGPTGDLLYPDVFTGEIKRLYYGTASPPVATPRPTARIDQPTSSVTWQENGTVAFSGGGTDTTGQPLPASALRWTLVILHCPTESSCHRHFIEDRVGIYSGSFTAPAHEDPAKLEIVLGATDPLTGTNDQTSVVLKRAAKTK